MGQQLGNHHVKMIRNYMVWYLCKLHNYHEKIKPLNFGCCSHPVSHAQVASHPANHQPHPHPAFGPFGGGGGGHAPHGHGGCPLHGVGGGGASNKPKTRASAAFPPSYNAYNMYQSTSMLYHPHPHPQPTPGGPPSAVEHLPHSTDPHQQPQYFVRATSCHCLANSLMFQYPPAGK